MSRMAGFLAALIVFPNGPFVAAASAQFNAAEAASHAVAPAGGMSAAAIAATSFSPSSLTVSPSAFAAPLSVSAPVSGPAALAPVVRAAALPAPAAVPVAVSASRAAPALRLSAAAPAPAAALRAVAAFSDGPSAEEKKSGASAAPAVALDGLAKLFDGSKEFSADGVKVALERADGKTVTTTLGGLDAVLRADPALAAAVNKGGAVRLVLKGHGSPKTGVPADLSTGLQSWLRGRGIEAPVAFERKRIPFVAFDLSILKNAPKLLRDSWTVPNKQDYAYLATKTFGLNLAVRVFFAAAAVHKGDLPLMRAVISTSWYQLQDAGFTLFGQTYMKFIGKMTGLMRVGRAYMGDFLFTYLQLTAFEFINRLVLGPIGENPIVYSPHGLSLIFTNVFMGMISGGPLVPAISKMRRAGVISQKTMMHLYQLASLTMQFGLLASFGYQHLYFILTTATLVLSWGAYAFFTLFTKDKPGIDTGMGGENKA
jgi:hypothetical protein